MTSEPPDTAAVGEAPFVSVVILSHNSGGWMQGCLDALTRSQGVKLEIICVDNASDDDGHDIAKGHPATTKALKSGRNLGCAGGNNLGWREATAPLIVFLNPDCHVQPDAVAALVAPLIEDQTIGATGALLYYPSSRRIQHAGGILHPNAMCEHHGMGQEDEPRYHEPKDVDYVTGAFFATRLEDLKALDGFDEEYFPAYYEETDYLERLKARGMRIRYVPGAVGYHWESVGLKKHSARFVRTSYRSRLRFVVKNYSLGRFLREFLPFELRWFFGPFARGFRGATLRSYASACRFGTKCLLRCSRRRRPGGRDSMADHKGSSLPSS